MSRADANSRVFAYIKENNLQDPKDRRVILPDDKLRSILVLDGLKADEGINYFNLAKFTKHNFTSIPAAQ